MQLITATRSELHDHLAAAGFVPRSFTAPRAARRVDAATDDAEMLKALLFSAM